MRKQKIDPAAVSLRILTSGSPRNGLFWELRVPLGWCPEKMCPFVFEVLRKRRADFGLGLWKQARSANECHPDIGADEHLGKLGTDIATSNDEQ